MAQGAKWLVIQPRDLALYALKAFRSIEENVKIV